MKRLAIYFILYTLFIFLSCQDKKEQNAQTKAAEEPAKSDIQVNAVCVWDKASLRETPRNDGKWLGSMSLAEKIVYTGNSKVDSTGKKPVTYCQVNLSDGIIGWVSEYSIEIEASPAIVCERTYLYKRPDFLTKSDQDLVPLDFVAARQEKDNWVEVVGAEKKKRGWVDKNSLIFSELNIAVGVLGQKALSEPDSAKRAAELKAIIENPAFSNSIFINYLKNELPEYQDSSLYNVQE
jgi:hypothetical protein